MVLLPFLLGFAVRSYLQEKGPKVDIIADMDAQIIALEAEHMSLLSPTDSFVHQDNLHHWTPPVFDNADNKYLFSWRVEIALNTNAEETTMPARNVSQVSAVLELSVPGRPPILCSPEDPSKTNLLCDTGPGTLHAEKYLATLRVVLRADTQTKSGLVGRNGHFIKPARLFNATKHGYFIRGIRSWGHAQWVGLQDPSDTAAQFRSTVSIRDFGFVLVFNGCNGSMAARATWQIAQFCAGLHGQHYRF